MSDYSDYSEVPFYRRNWFFWLTFFFIDPVAIIILLTGEVYYEKSGELRVFGMPSRIVAGLIAAVIVYGLFSPGSSGKRIVYTSALRPNVVASTMLNDEVRFGDAVPMKNELHFDFS